MKSTTPLLVALVLAGCGSSSGSSSSTHASTPPPSSTTGPSANKPPPVSSDRASYITAADALCKSSNAHQETLRQRSKGLTTVKLVPILHEQATIAATLSTDLGRLTPPTADRKPVARFLQAVRQLSVYSLAVANSIAAGHTFAARSLAAKLGLARQQETLLGQGYGYNTCASGKAY